MGTVASFIMTSLDGFSEGPNGELDWPVVDEEFDRFAIRQLDEADTLGFGRATYEHMAAHWPTDQAQANDPAITSRMNTKPKVVFSTSLDHAAWSNTSIIAGEAVEQIGTVKAAPGGKLLVLGSAHSPPTSLPRAFSMSCGSWSARSPLGRAARSSRA
jgi:dihydrofolate reductase